MDTLVGVLPDNVNVPSLPFSFPRIAIYTRLSLDLKDSPGDIPITISSPGKGDESVGVVSKDRIAEAQAAAKKSGSPIVGINLKIVASPFPVEKEGQISIVITIEGQKYIGGVLNIKLATRQDSSIA